MLNPRMPVAFPSSKSNLPSISIPPVAPSKNSWAGWFDSGLSASSNSRSASKSSPPRPPPPTCPSFPNPPPGPPKPPPNCPSVRPVPPPSAPLMPPRPPNPAPPDSVLSATIIGTSPPDRNSGGRFDASSLLAPAISTLSNRSSKTFALDCDVLVAPSKVIDSTSAFFLSTFSLIPSSSDFDIALAWSILEATPSSIGGFPK